MNVRSTTGVAGHAPQAVTSPLRNGLWNAASNALTAVAGLVCSVVVVRSLNVEAYGVFSYYLWLASVTGAIGVLALPHALTKVSAELIGQGRPQDAEALTALVWRGTLLLNGLITLVIALAWLRTPQAPYLLVVGAVQVPVALAAIASSYLWARQNYRPVALWTGAAAVVQVALVVAAQLLGWEGPGFAAAVLGSGAVIWLGLAGALPRTAPHRQATVTRNVRAQYAAFLLPATLTRLIEVVVWQRSELLFLSRLSTTSQIGFYSLAYTIYAIVLAVGWALINGYYPALSQLHGARQPEHVVQKVNQGVRVATLYAAPVSFGMIAVLGGVIRLLYGEKMLPAVQVGQVLLLGLTPGVICGMLTLTLSAVGRVWYGVTLGLIVAILNLLLALWLIGGYGALGGAVATTVSQVVYFVLLAAVVVRVCRFPLSWRQPALNVLLAAVTTLALPLWIERVGPGPDVVRLVLATVLGGGAYVAVIWKSGQLSGLRADQDGA